LKHGLSDQDYYLHNGINLTKKPNTLKINSLLAGTLALVLVAGLGTPAFAATTATGVDIPSGSNISEPSAFQTQQNCIGLNTFDDRTAFDNAVGGTTLEDFTPTSHLPISTGILNSATNLVVAIGPPILPGDIQPGVTYSMPIGTGSFFNIDFGGFFFTGGFLDGIKNPEFDPVTITFDNPVAAFGFDTEPLMGRSFDITIQFTSGPDFVGNFPVPQGLSFFGFQSEQIDIETVIIQGDGFSSFDYAFDNFAFGGKGCDVVVGGELIPIQTTSLILAGAQSFSWMIPVVLSVIGIGLFAVSRKA